MHFAAEGHVQNAYCQYMMALFQPCIKGLNSIWCTIVEVLSVGQFYNRSQFIRYLTGQKGSDVSAREATKKLVSATKQMHALQAVLQDIHGASMVTAQQQQHLEPRMQSSDENGSAMAEQAGPWAAKNTIVKDVLRELTNATRQSRTRLQAGSLHHTGAALTVQRANRPSPVKQK